MPGQKLQSQRYLIPNLRSRMTRGEGRDGVCDCSQLAGLCGTAQCLESWPLGVRTPSPLTLTRPLSP